MSASNVCPNCRAVNGPANLFCVNCGTRLVAGPAAPPTPVPPAYPPTPPYLPSVPAPYPYLPGPPPRRVTFSTILSGMFDVWTKNFATFFVVFLVLALVNGLIAGLLALAILGTFGRVSGFPGVPFSGVTLAGLGNLIVLGILVAIAEVIVNSIVTGGMTEFAVRRFRRESISLERALRRGLEKFPSIFGANLLLSLFTVALVFVPLLLIFGSALSGSAGSGGGVALLCGALIALVFGGIVALYFAVAMSLYPPAIMMENANATGGLIRSWRMTKGHWWTLFGALLVAGILGGLITAAITFPVAFFRNPIADLIASALASGFVGAWFLILVAVAYDLLVRQPTLTAPPYYPAPPMAPPIGAGQVPQPPQPPPAPPSPPGL